MRYWKNNFFNSWAIKNQRYSEFVKKCIHHMMYPVHMMDPQSIIWWMVNIISYVSCTGNIIWWICTISYIAIALTNVSFTLLVKMTQGVSLWSFSNIKSKFIIFSRGIFEGLVYLHHKDVVHGALSPNNVLLDDRGNIRLSDFGLHCLSSPR